MVSCSDVVRMVASDDGSPRPATRRIALRIHLLFCDSCRRYMREVREIGIAVKRRVIETEAATRDREAEERILRALGMEAGESPPAPPSERSG